MFFRKKQATNQIIQKECKTMVQIRTSGSENHDNNAIELKVIVAKEGEDIGNINLNNFEIHLFNFYSE